MPDEPNITAESKTLEAPREIASEARRRINLLASRVPGVRAFLKPPMPPPLPPTERVAVISDFHLGDPMSTMDDRTGDRLCSAIADLGRLDQLILLGDIFDFWQAPLGDAIEAGKGLIPSLFLLDNVKSIVHVPGNHDHHVCRMYFEEETARRLRAGNLEPPELTIPMTDDCPVMAPLVPDDATVPLSMVYPFHQLTVQGKSVLFTHGHLLGLFERSLWMRNAMMSSLLLAKGQSLSLEDVERFASPYYEMLALSTSMPGVVNGRYRIYRAVIRAGKALGLAGESRTSSLRDTTVEQNAVELEALLDQLTDEKPDYFVYGHTHRAGKLVLPLSGVTAVNSGCWLANEYTRPSNIIVEISDDAYIHVV